MSQPIRIRVTAIIVRDDKLLLIKCHDEPFGLHYNVPGGGLEYGETLEDALRREIKEETCVDIDVGPLMMLFEVLRPDEALPKGIYHSLGVFFKCTILNGDEPRLPDTPDEFQIGVEWVAIEDLANIPLLPRHGELLQNIIQRDDPAPLIYQSRSPY